MLKLKKEDYEKILDHCRKGLPNESCGLLGGTIEGDVKTIEKVYLLTNIDESNDLLFRLDVPVLFPEMG